MIKEEVKLKLGEYKTFLNRLISYLGILNFIMLLYIFIKNKPFNINWFIWAIIIILLSLSVIIFDTLFIIESEGTYIFKKNPKLVELEKKVDLILAILQEKKL